MASLSPSIDQKGEISSLCELSTHHKHSFESPLVGLSARSAVDSVISWATLPSPQDVSSWEAQHALFMATIEAFGPRIDFVIANAGVSNMKGMRVYESDNFGTDSRSLEDIKDSPPDLKTLQVNLDGCTYSAYLAFAQFRQQGPDASGWKGKLIFTGSAA